MTDAQVFFAAVLGLSIVLLAGEALTRLLGAAAESAHGPAVIARVAPLSSIRPIYVFFVLLPTALAVLAIGVPFLLRLVRAAIGRRLGAREWLGLGGLGAAVAVLVVEARLGGNGAAGLGAAAVLGLWQTWGLLGAQGGVLATRLLGGAGLALAGLAYYQSEYVGAAERSVAIAPTLLVCGFFFLLSALLPLTAGALAAGSRRRGAAIAGWVAGFAWLSAASVRSFAPTAAAADRLEVQLCAACAGLLVIAALIAEVRR